MEKTVTEILQDRMDKLRVEVKIRMDNLSYHHREIKGLTDDIYKYQSSITELENSIETLKA